MFFFVTCFFKKNIDVEQKAKHRIKKAKIRKGDWNEKRREETNKHEKGLMNKNSGIEYFDVALVMKQKQRRNTKKETKTRNQKTAKKKTRRKEERREKERGREKESGKGEAKKGQGERKSNTQK